MEVTRDEGKGAARIWRAAVLWLLAVAALAGQVVLVWRVPAQFQQPACWMMSMLWLAGAELVARLTGSRAATAIAPTPGRRSGPPAAAGDDDRQPSRRMHAAWLAARTGGDAELVAQVAGVPHALAELIVADARCDPDGHDA